MTNRGKEFLVLTCLLILLGYGSESQYCGRKSCDTRGKIFHYAGHLRPTCDIHGNEASFNPVCSSYENATSLSTMKIVTHGSGATNLPNKIVCLRPEPYFTRCSLGSSKKCRWRTAFVCKEIGASGAIKAICPSSKSVNVSFDDNTVIVSWLPALCFNNSRENFSASCTHDSGTPFGIGNATVQCNCTDRPQNSEQCSFFVVVKDVTSPVLECPPEQIVNATLNNNRNATVKWDAVNCSDNSGENISSICTAQSGTEFGLGNTTVNCSCQDGSHNIGHCSFYVMVKDVTPPSMDQCPSNLSANASIYPYKKAVVRWNNVVCSDNSDRKISPICTNHSGFEFDLGETTVNCSCKDDSDNIGWCSFPVVVNDITQPNASCPKDQTVGANSYNDTKAFVKWNETLCSDNSNQDISPQCTKKSGDAFGLGNTTVNCSCSDDSGNTGQCSFHIMVKDVTSPTAKCPDNKVVKANKNNDTEVDVKFEPTYCSDNSPGNISPSCTHQSGRTFALGNTTVQCNCTDASGNENGCSFLITVKAPTAYCPAGESKPADLDNDTTALVNWTMPTCRNTHDWDVSCSHEQEDKFPLGNTTVQCNCSSGSQYTDECSFTILVTDETDPEAVCPTDIIVTANHDNNTKAPAGWQLQPCSDNSNGIFLLGCSHSSGHKFGLGNTTVRCSCSDWSGNTGECSFQVMVTDGKGPAANCPNDQTLNASLDGNKTATADWNAIECAGNFNLNMKKNCSHEPGKFPLGITTVACSCTDVSGKVGFCSFQVEVKDATRPTAKCPSNQVVNASLYNNTKAVGKWNLPSCPDNSKENISAECTHQPGDEFPLGTAMVKCNCTDKSGNRDQCSFRVIVKDVTPPKAHCPENQILNATLEGNKTALGKWAPASCSDDNTAGNFSLGCTYQTGTKFGIGNTTIQCNCTDTSGNTGECYFHVLVNDITDPIAQCPANQTVNASQDGDTTSVVRWNPPNCTDNSDGGTTWICNSQSGGSVGLGSTDVQCTCRDSSNNTGQCSFRITVEDGTKPKAHCPAKIIANANLVGNTEANVTWNQIWCSDNADKNFTSNCTHKAGTHFALGMTTVICSCTDTSRNTGRCSFRVEVKDVTNPTANCPASQTHYVSENERPKVVAEWGNEETNCTDNSQDLISPQCSHHSGNTFSEGDTRVKCNCEDSSRNIGQCFFSIIVIVVEDPVLSESLIRKNFFERNSGEEFSLSCTADNAEEFWWEQKTFRGTQRISNSSGIEIHHVTFQGQGNYFCTAKGKARSAISYAQVLVVKDYLQFAVKVLVNTTFRDNVSTTVNKTLMKESFEVVHQKTSQEGFLNYIVKKVTNETDPTIVYNLMEEKMSDIRDNLTTFDYESVNTAYCTGGTITTTDGDLNFPNARVGKTVKSSEISLTSRASARATRKCDGDFITSAVWKEPVITKVTRDIEENITKSIENLAKNLEEQTVTSSNASYVADVLENVTASEEIETEHFVTVASALNLVVEAQNVSQKVTTTVLLIIDNVVKTTSSNKSDASLNSNTSAAFLDTLQQQLDNVRDSGLSFNFTTNNIAVRIVQVPFENIVAIYKLPFAVDFEEGRQRNVTETISDDELEYFPKGNTDNGDDSVDDKASIRVDPVAISKRAGHLTNDSGLVPISFMVQRGTALFPERRNDGMKVNTLVVSASVQGTVNGLPDESNIVTHFHPIQERRCAKISCVYWDEFEGTGRWSRNGCRSTASKHLDSSYTCHCNHLTNFAVLLDVEGDIESRFLDYVSIIGCIVSTWCIIMTICSYLGIKKFRSSRPQQIVLNICFALLGLYLSFLAGIEQIHLEIGCIVFGALIHFFTLASVAWMSVEATNMYLLFVKVFNANIRHFMIKASIVGWGIPGVTVVISAVLSPDSYSNCKYCFPDSESMVFYISVIGVVSLLVTYNFIIFVLVTRKLTCARTAVSKANLSKQETFRRLQNVVAISFLLGVTWIFGLLSFGEIRGVSNFIFCALNSFQGLCIFVLFCARQKEIRSAWKTWLLMSVGRPQPTSSKMSTSSRGLSKKKLISEEDEEKTSSVIKSSRSSKVELSDLKSEIFADEISHNLYSEVKGTTYDDVDISESACYADVDPKDRNLPPIPEEGHYSKEISSALDQNGVCETSVANPELYMEIGEGHTFINEGDEYQSLTNDRTDPQEYMDLSFSK